MRRILLGLIVMASCAILGCPPRSDEGKKDKDKSDADKKPVVDFQPQVGNLEHLKKRVKAAIDEVKHRDLRADKSFWTIFHGILGNGLETKLYQEGSKSYVNALEFIRGGGKVRGMEFIAYENGLDVLTATPNSDLTYVGQGHQDQFIAEMIQIGLPLDAKFTVKGKDYSFKDFCRYSRARASTTKNQELSWAIIVIGQVYGLNHEWENQDGEKLKFEDVVRYELNQPIGEMSACGGTHRLFGLSWVYNLHRQQGGKKEGVWKDVADKLLDYKNKAKKFRNGDGSFSTQYVSRAENSGDSDRKINTTGHTFEWLALTLPDSELSADWMQEAAYALSKMILDQGNASVDGGSLYHAAHGLNLYYDRLFGTVNANVPLPPKEW